MSEECRTVQSGECHISSRIACAGFDPAQTNGSIPGTTNSGAVEETRTLTRFRTAPSRQRVYQFHHDGIYCEGLILLRNYLVTVPGLFSPPLVAGAGAGVPDAAGAGMALAPASPLAGSVLAGTPCMTPPLITPVDAFGA